MHPKNDGTGWLGSKDMALYRLDLFGLAVSIASRPEAHRMGSGQRALPGVIEGTLPLGKRQLKATPVRTGDGDEPPLPGLRQPHGSRVEPLPVRDGRGWLPVLYGAGFGWTS